MRWAGHVVGMVERRVACRVLVERPEEMRPLGKRKIRLEVNSKMDLYEVGRDVDCTDLDQDRNRSRAFVNLVIKLPVQNILGISWPTEKRLANQEGLCSLLCIVNGYSLVWSRV